jgi:DGQHR domain-containing protein
VVKKSVAKVITKSAYSYSCSAFAQRQDPKAPRFCVFAASAGDILEWSDIERLGPGVPGVQRRENPAKRRQIAKFFLNDKLNTIPTAVIVAFDGTQASVTADSKTIRIARSKEGSRKAALVIDGQHRLLGISDFDKTVKVPVVGILNASDVEKAFQFLVINNKGSKVSRSHVKALALEYKDAVLASRLRTARIALDKDRLVHVEILNTSKDSPFANRVDFPNTKGNLPKIVPEAFEKALQYIESLNLPKLEDPDIQRDFFTAIWRSIEASWGSKIFEPNCKLTEKVGIICMTRYLVDRLAAMSDIEDVDLDLADLKDVGDKVEKLLSRQTLQFWLEKWKGAGYDTSIGHTKVIEALIKIFRNTKDGKEWHTDLDIV